MNNAILRKIQNIDAAIAKLINCLINIKNDDVDPNLFVILNHFRINFLTIINRIIENPHADIDIEEIKIGGKSQ